MSPDPAPGREFGFVAFIDNPQRDEATRRFVRQNARWHVGGSKKQSSEKRATALPHILKAKEIIAGSVESTEGNATRIFDGRSSSSKNLDDIK
jgi:hypothetical protein